METSMRFTCFTLIFILLYFMFPPTSSSKTNSIDTAEVLNRLVRLEAHSENQDDRLTKQELKTKQTETQLNDLETRIVKLSEKNANILYTKIKNKLGTEILTRNERPARLLPFNFLRGKPKNKTPAILFPSNCDDLNKLGHTLNGIYLVNEKRHNKIGAMFCNFQQDYQRPDSPFLEKFFGFINIKYAGVYFYVHRKFSDNMKQSPNAGVINFNEMILNTGKALNLISGVFTAPVNGTYSFHFTGHRDTSHIAYMTTALTIDIRLNKQPVSRSYTTQFTALISCQCILKLKMGDNVDVYKHIGYLNGQKDTQFSGYLLEEDFKF